ncbi:MAG: type 4a pilus biogenesis protein PilO [Patescibacteria group bacterium]|nr:type 4a pilus biogenesis protein PilO [Patescibacteria group bacterium]
MSGLKIILYPLTFSGVLLVIFTLIVPTYKQAKQIKQVDIVEAKAKLEEIRKVNKNISSLKESVSLYQDDLRTLKYALPEESDLKSFLIQIEAIMLNNEIFFETMDPLLENQTQIASSNAAQTAQTAIIEPAQKTTIKLSMRGGYEKLIQSLEQIEKLNRVSNVASVQFKIEEQGAAAEESPPADFLEAEVDLEIYHQETITAELIAQFFQSAQTNLSTPSNDTISSLNQTP